MYDMISQELYLKIRFKKNINKIYPIHQIVFTNCRRNRHVRFKMPFHFIGCQMSYDREAFNETVTDPDNNVIH